MTADSVCACACACARMRACVCVWMGVCVCTHVFVHTRDIVMNRENYLLWQM